MGERCYAGRPQGPENTSRPALCGASPWGGFLEPKYRYGSQESHAPSYTVGKMGGEKIGIQPISQYVFTLNLWAQNDFFNFFSLSLKVLLGIPISCHDFPLRTARAKALSDLLSLRIALSIRFFSFM